MLDTKIYQEIIIIKGKYIERLAGNLLISCTSHLDLLSFIIDPFFPPEFLRCQYNFLLFLYFNLMTEKERLIISITLDCRAPLVIKI